MSRLCLALLALFVLFLVTGCVPERVVWSPDGSQALVLGDDGLHSCTPDGKLSPVLIHQEVTRVAWLPDGKHFIAASQADFATWNDIIKANPDAKPDADTVAKMRKYITDGVYSAVADLPPDEKTRAGIFLRDTEPNILPLPNTIDYVNETKHYTPVTFQLFELEGEKAVPGPVLFYGGEQHRLEIRPSPDGKCVAITEIDDHNQKAEVPQLRVVLTRLENGKRVRLDLGDSCMYPDWAPEGDAIVYERPDEQKSPVGTVTRQKILSDKGELLGKGELPPREELAGVLFGSMGRVRCAKDGRIFFSTIEITLPAAPHDLVDRGNLFMVQPGKVSTITRVLPRDVQNALSNSRMEFFDLSPDGRIVSIPSEAGGVAVMEIGTGQSVQLVKDGDGKIDSLPTWRSAKELTYIDIRDGKKAVVRTIVTDPERPTVVLSGTWSKEAAESLTIQAPATQPVPMQIIPGH